MPAPPAENFAFSGAALIFLEPRSMLMSILSSKASAETVEMPAFWICRISPTLPLDFRAHARGEPNFLAIDTSEAITLRHPLNESEEFHRAP